MSTIAIINHSHILTNDQIKAIIPDLQTQIDRDFTPIWGISAKLVFIDNIAQLTREQWQVAIFDNSDQAGALGYHDVTIHGLPLGKVFAKTVMDYKQSWTVTMSHEILEMLADPDINLVAQISKSRFYAYEVCDPCEADVLGYKINNTLVSDFVYPAWFESFNTIAQYDFSKKITKPLQILHGGYIGYIELYSSSGWKQLTAGELQYADRAKVGSRREKRMTPREEWLNSTV